MVVVSDMAYFRSDLHQFSLTGGKWEWAAWGSNFHKS
jgi:hypothetical protein